MIGESYFPGCISGQEMVTNAENIRDVGSVSGWGRSPGGGYGKSITPVFLPGKLHGQRSLEGYSPWGHKESNVTEMT